MMNFLALITPFFLAFSLVNNPSIDDEIQNAFMKNNVKLISKHFSNTLNISISREEYTATKFQAELLLKDFIKNNPASEIKKVSIQSADGNYRYFIYNLKSGRKNYRILAKVIDHKNTIFISDLRIE